MRRPLIWLLVVLCGPAWAQEAYQPERLALTADTTLRGHDGQPSARIAADTFVQLYARRGDEVAIVVPGHRGGLVGWVPRASVKRLGVHDAPIQPLEEVDDHGAIYAGYPRTSTPDELPDPFLTHTHVDLAHFKDGIWGRVARVRKEIGLARSPDGAGPILRLAPGVDVEVLGWLQDGNPGARIPRATVARYVNYQGVTGWLPDRVLERADVNARIRWPHRRGRGRVELPRGALARDVVLSQVDAQGRCTEAVEPTWLDGTQTLGLEAESWDRLQVSWFRKLSSNDYELYTGWIPREALLPVHPDPVVGDPGSATPVPQQAPAARETERHGVLDAKPFQR